jgi:hypothetical protein
MNVTPSKQPDGRTSFVVPEMRPSPDRPSRLRVGVGVVCLVIGFIGIFFGGGDAVGQASLIAGGIFVLAGLFAFRGFRIRVQRGRGGEDIRKLYGTPKV